MVGPHVGLDEGQSGRVGGVEVACLQGRVHLYEGHSPQTVAFGVRMLAALGGIPGLVLTGITLILGQWLTSTDAATEALPVLMITSRSADKHQQLAREAGVDAYLGKPYQESQLLDAVALY